MTHIPVPTPGSPRALEHGCTCPVLTNHYGRGVSRGPDGAPYFEFHLDCPLHGAGDWRDHTIKDTAS